MSSYRVLSCLMCTCIDFCFVVLFARGRSSEPTPTPPTPMKVEKADAAVETERMTAAPPSVVRGLMTPPLSRSETGDSVEIVCDVLA